MHVTVYLLGILTQLAASIERPERRRAITDQVGEVLEALDEQSFTDTDRERIRAKATAVFDLPYR